MRNYSIMVDKLTQQYELLLQQLVRLGYDIKDENFTGTPRRAAKGILEIGSNLEWILSKTKLNEHPELGRIAALLTRASNEESTTLNPDELQHILKSILYTAQQVSGLYLDFDNEQCHADTDLLNKAKSEFSRTLDWLTDGLMGTLRSKVEINEKIEEMLTKTFPAKHNDMVVCGPIESLGLCPHHLLPVYYLITVAYIPTERVIGISKLARVSRLLAARPVLQEDVGGDIIDILHNRLKSSGAAAHVYGWHTCMTCRGIKAPEAGVHTCSVSGAFEQQTTRTEFLRMVDLNVKFKE